MHAVILHPIVLGNTQSLFLITLTDNVVASKGSLLDRSIVISLVSSFFLHEGARLTKSIRCLGQTDYSVMRFRSLNRERERETR